MLTKILYGVRDSVARGLGRRIMSVICGSRISVCLSWKHGDIVIECLHLSLLSSLKILYQHLMAVNPGREKYTKHGDCIISTLIYYHTKRSIWKLA